MNDDDIETRLRVALLPVFGFDAIDEIPAGASLVGDIGADSLDFVEITYLIERNFGVVLKPGQLVVAGADVDADSYFVEDKLTAEGAAALGAHLPGAGGRFVAGITRVDLFRSITVRDLANMIRQSGGKPC